MARRNGRKGPAHIREVSENIFFVLKILVFDLQFPFAEPPGPPTPTRPSWTSPASPSLPGAPPRSSRGGWRSRGCTGWSGSRPKSRGQTCDLTSDYKKYLF